ncbi:hypothetical protein G647_09150 [Cladophialophora carrionii CBS 160.54]|uniref:Uncharacterized protein n=1 Tax=Cladophialophora carrionii CBS 160.54 TaxID=1279043 RepID=V9CZ47_9EURO|nr:uncharacterized protein G647_09150 [Cladophialophora carrionii CBS 160.54]ETI19318.1 hypothetical protein G647_09150 [Cladophialophora carrionii CBS 160.54]
MGPKSRIIIVDQVMPEAGVLSSIEEQRKDAGHRDDVSFHSLGRDEEGWQSLIKQADERLELHSIRKITENILAVLEVGLKQNNE